MAIWTTALDELLGRVAGRFHRVEPRRRAAAYVRGLLAPLAGKNGCSLAEAACEGTPDGMQRLLNAATWDAAGVRDDVRAYISQHLGAGGALVVDETGFPKKGSKSAGVQRQYSGVAGRIENCQLGVFLAYRADRSTALLDRELYLPRSWTADRARCREALVPDDAQFATKVTLARRMIARTLAADVPARWIVTDKAYGREVDFRSWLEEHRVGYVVEVPCNQIVCTTMGRVQADHLAAGAPPQAWKRRPANAGEKRQCLYDWAVAELPVEADVPFGWARWLLVCRRYPRRGSTSDLTYHLCFGAADTADDELIRVACSRWAMGECFRAAKAEVGLDQYQVRGYDAWYRHITLAMLAHALLAVTAATRWSGIRPHVPTAEKPVTWHT